MSGNLRLRYPVKSAFFFVSTVVSAIPMEQSQGRRTRKRQEKNSSALEKTIEDAVHLDKDIQAANNSDDEDGSDSDDSNDDDDDKPSENDSRNIPSTNATSIPSATLSPHVSNSALPGIVEGSSGSSTTRNLAIAGGTVGGFILLALLGFALYRWKAPTKDSNSGPWNDEKYPPPPGGPVYQTPSTLFGGGSSQRENPIPRMPAMPKPPPLVLVPQDRPLRDPEQLGGRMEGNRTFFLESDPNRESNLSNLSNIPPVYDELRSPSMESSISQTVPYPNKNASRKVYASFHPPPIPESPPAAADPNQSRFSWTTKRTSVDSAPRFRGVTSWVNYQTTRMSMKEKLAKLGLEEAQAPATPVTFRHHPGAPVSFLVQHGRQESAELDRKYRSGR